MTNKKFVFNYSIKVFAIICLVISNNNVFSQITSCGTCPFDLLNPRVTNGTNLEIHGGRITNWGRMIFRTNTLNAANSNTFDFKGQSDVTKLYISDLGNVGIGDNITNPLTKLQVNSSGVNSHLLISGGSPGLRFSLLSTGTTDLAGLGLVNNSNDYFQGSVQNDFAIRNLNGKSIVFATNIGAVSTERFRISNVGNIGIGFSTPSAKLSLGNDLNNTKLILNEGTANGIFGIGYQANQMRFHLGNSNAKFSFLNTSSGAEAFSIDGSGNFNALGKASINGAVIPTGYHLAVKGKLICEELKVKFSGQWPDTVFSSYYTLPSLTEVEAYYKENKHLKDVPSQAEVNAEGIQSGQMDATLLKKIEEITIYMVELNKEVQALKEKNKQLELQLQQR